MPVTPTETSGLASTPDILALGMRADEVRRERHGARTTFVRVAGVPVDAKTAVEIPPAAGEIRLIGRPASRAAAIAAVAETSARAKGTPVSAFSLDDLEELASEEGVTLRSVLEDLRAAGAELVAEAPFDRLRDAKASIEEVNIAGLTLARLTIRQWSTPDSAALFKRIADLQRAVGVIRAFAPLARTISPAVPTTGFDDVRRVALARLIVDNVPSIQVDWSLYGPKLAQVALTFGADDVDAVPAADDMSGGRRRAPLEEIRRNIRAAGLEPVERNGRFEAVAAP
jgi:aminodeoxyfutalosine synthase